MHITPETIPAALSRRAALAARFECLRLFDGRGDGFAELYIDRYGLAAIAHALPKDFADEEQIRELLPAALSAAQPEFARIGVSTLYLRVHAKDARKHREESAAPLWGVPIDELAVREGPGEYLVRPHGSLFAGLYPDMREVRAYLSANSRGRRMLNLFAFTGSLGIAAALGGAAEVAHIDSSPAALEWAKKNWERNKDALECDMRFICDDCRHFLERESARVAAGGKRTDIVAFDPPSFGRGRKRTFSLKRDGVEILKRIFEILAPNGRVIFTANSRAESPESLGELARNAAEAAGFSVTAVEALFPPEADYPARGRDSIAMRGVLISG